MILLLQLPSMPIQGPSQGPAVLKAIAQQEGFKCTCFDLNLQVWKDMKDEYGYLWHDWAADFVYALDPSDEFHEVNDSAYDKNLAELIKKTLFKHLRATIEYNTPRVIGLSVFSILQNPVAEIVIDYIQENYPFVETIIGGPAFRAYDVDSIPTELFEKVDNYIIGDAEIAWREYLRGNEYPGLNNMDPKRILSYDEFPTPDYSDADITEYDNQKILYVTGSKGCVRQCEFCDVHKIWPKFNQKETLSVVRDMKTLSEHHDVDYFYFTDSLINGSNKFVKDLSEQIIETFPDRKFSWGGFWITKNPKSFDESYYKVAAESGLSTIMVGVESGSEKVRNDMNKKIKDEDIEFTLRMCDKYNIRFVAMMICGFPTETEEDFEKSLEFVRLLGKYKHVASTATINLMMLLPGTDVVIDREKYDIANVVYGETKYGFTPHDQQWSCGDNDYKTRIERFYRYQYEAKKNGCLLDIGKRKTLKRDYLRLEPNPSDEILMMIEAVDNDCVPQQ